MLVILGLIVLLAAVVVGVTGVLTNAGSAHLLTDHFAVFGYHVTGSTGTLLLYGMVIGAVAAIGLAVLLAGARRAASRGRDARRELERTRHDTVAETSDPRIPLEVRPGTGRDATPSADDAAVPDRRRFGFLRRRSARERTGAVHHAVKD
jgi:hypothetical protein